MTSPGTAPSTENPQVIFSTYGLPVVNQFTPGPEADVALGIYVAQPIVPTRIYIALATPRPLPACMLELSYAGAVVAKRYPAGDPNIALDAFSLDLDPNTPAMSGNVSVMFAAMDQATAVPIALVSIPQGSGIQSSLEALAMKCCILADTVDDATIVDLTLMGSGPRSQGGFVTQGMTCVFEGSSVEASCAVGEALTIAVRIVPAGIFTMTRTEWTVTGPNVNFASNPIADYVTVGLMPNAPTTATIVPKVLNALPIETTHTFYFTVPGNYEVTVAVTALAGPLCENAGSQTAAKVVFLRVAAPTVQFPLTVARPVKIDTIAAAGAVPAMPAIAFGAVLPLVGNLTGFNMYVTVDADAGVPRGRLRTVQLTRFQTTLTGAGGATLQIGTGGAEMLDGKLPYDGFDNLAAMGNKRLQVADSPHQGIRPGYTQIVHDQSFRMFVQYCPNKPDAIYVTLGYFAWSWSATAGTAGGAAFFAPGSPAYTNQASPNGRNADANVFTLSTELPVWAGVVPANVITVPPPVAGASYAGPVSVVTSTDGDFSQIMFTAAASALNPNAPVTADALGAALGVPVYPVTDYENKQYWWTWAPSLNDTPSYILTWDALSQGRRLEGMRQAFLNPKSPPQPPFLVWLYIAPWCIGDAARWTQLIASYPPPSDGSAPDYSVQAFMATVQTVVPQGTTVTVSKGNPNVLELSFTDVPSQDQLEALTSLTQTFSLRPVSHMQIMPVPPDPELPSQ